METLKRNLRIHMLKEQQELSQQIEGVETTVHSFAFDSSSKGIKLIPDKVYTVSKQKPFSEHVDNCFIAWVNDNPLIRSGSIETKVKAEEFLVIVRALHQELMKKKSLPSLPLRFCANPVCSVEFEWDLIARQHLHLIRMNQNLQEGEQLVQISTELGNLYSDQPPERKLKSVTDALEKMPKLVNMDAWASYCAWYNHLLEEAFSHFLYDAADEYTLEKYLKNFRHEVYSPFLKQTRKRLVEFELLIESQETTEDVSYRDLVDMAKKRVVFRNDLHRMIRAHYDNLVEIVRLIKVIKEAHPELSQLLDIGQVLQRLLANQVEANEGEPPSWGETQMLLQLLNDELGVVSAINGTYGLDRTNLAFAIRLSVMQMKEIFSREEVFDMVLNWEEAAKAVNKILVQKGETENLADPKRATPVVRFRECVLSNLLDFCLPIIRLNTEGKTPQWQEGLLENLMPLNFLPPFHTMPNAINEPERMALINYHPETGIPVGLTDAGYRFMTSLSYTEIEKFRE
ncbi:MAG: hypothetical protein ACE5GN_04215 [Waddliaceae bacterium]